VTDAPPDDVHLAILVGGPLDTIVMEIDTGQTEMTPTWIYSLDPAPPIPTYRYVGKLDNERRAVFAVAGGANTSE
jgi:hypothetical protein